MNKEERKLYLRDWRSKNKAKQKEYRDKPSFKLQEANRHLVRTYGITSVDKQKMWDEQDGLCAVCLKPLPNISHRDCQVEHCHTTGKVRGLAHWYCNIVVGVMETNPTLLDDVVLYLHNHK